MNASLAEWCMLTDVLMRKRMVLSLKVGKSITDAETGRVTIPVILLLCQSGFTKDFIDALGARDEGERRDEMDPSRTEEN